ncbi:dynein heavy chain family protein [Cystoisospora suis]|uniref:Dynein heavy chain family protein n=1 Tax=Cystoisospora suis TaxID=483139 RepID=A0A2C6KGD9_9APIC|nr:dynein heavy chain family protein [Cystoisospora suis]
MAALHPRHRWMISQIVAAFGLEEDENAVEASFRGQFYPKIEKFLNGTSRRQYVLFGYQKPRESRNATPGPPDPSLDAKLICTDGTESGLESRSIYFLKTTPRGKAVNLNVPSDCEVLFGEVAAAPLSSLDVTLADVFLPVVERFNENDW